MAGSAVGAEARRIVHRVDGDGDGRAGCGTRRIGNCVGERSGAIVISVRCEDDIACAVQSDGPAGRAVHGCDGQRIAVQGNVVGRHIRQAKGQRDVFIRRRRVAPCERSNVVAGQSKRSIRETKRLDPDQRVGSVRPAVIGDPERPGLSLGQIDRVVFQSARIDGFVRTATAIQNIVPGAAR